MVGSDKNPLSSKHHGLREIFKDKAKQAEYENHLHSLVEHQGKYYKLEDKNHAVSGGRSGSDFGKHKGATEHVLHPDEIALKQKLHKENKTSPALTDEKDLKNRLAEDSYFGTGSTQKTAAHHILTNREGATKEELRSGIASNKPAKVKAEKPVNEEKEHKEYQRYLIKSTKEINSGLSKFDYSNSTFQTLVNFIKKDVSKKAVLKSDTPVSFIDSKGKERKGEWGKLRHWVMMKASNPSEANSKLPLKDIKIQTDLNPKPKFDISQPDSEGWEKVNYVKKSIEQEFDILEKFVGGAGSRGGKVIGYTTSGKPIYEDKNRSHKGFEPNDHLEAADFHENLKAESLKKQEEINHKISKLPDHQLFTDKHQELSNQESDARHNVIKHEKGRLFHLQEGLKNSVVEKANENEMEKPKNDDGWGNNSVMMGRTKNKKEVYSNANSAKHKSFDFEDHKDAYTLHGLEAVKAHQEMGKWIEAGDKDKTDAARDKYSHHSEQYEIHRKLAKESEKKMKDQTAKKKIVDNKKTTEQKKKADKKMDSLAKAFEDLIL